MCNIERLEQELDEASQDIEEQARTIAALQAENDYLKNAIKVAIVVEDEQKAEIKKLRDALRKVCKWYGMSMKSEFCTAPDCYQCNMTREVIALLKEGDDNAPCC